MSVGTIGSSAQFTASVAVSRSSDEIMIAAPQIIKKSSFDAAPVKIAAVENLGVHHFNDKNLQDLKNNLKDYYVVADSRFTIYKDSSGRYITRSVSLIDGRVTYSPDPNSMRTTPITGDASYIKLRA